MVEPTSPRGALPDRILGMVQTRVEITTRGQVTRTNSPTLPESARKVIARLPQTRK